MSNVTYTAPVSQIQSMSIVESWRKLIALSLFGLLAILSLLCQVTLAQGADKSDYRLGPGDVIRIAVFQSPDLLLESRVSETGTISYPLIGTIGVGGLTITVAEKKITQLLKEGGFVLDPQVSIILLTVRGNQVSVLGQVNRPGRYPLELANMKLSDVLALAGGVVPGGADSVILIGTREGKLVRKVIDIPSMMLGGDLENDVAVQNGDILYVNRAEVFYVYGEVQRPGSYRIEREMTLMQALAQGGGVTARGTENGIRVFRRDKSGKLQRLEPELQDLIRPDDVIRVREKLF